MIWIGVTGGIGSGKSLVCSEFARLNIPIFFADDIAKEIADNDDTVRTAIRMEFGANLYDSDNKLNRRELASIVFGHPDRLNTLNSIIHPVVFQRFSDWKGQQEENELASSYGIVEAALMFESGFFELMDYILLVESDTQTRIQRVMMRDHVIKSSVQERIESQASPEILRELSDFVIQNSSTIAELNGKVQFFHIVFKNLKKREEIL